MGRSSSEKHSSRRGERSSHHHKKRSREDDAAGEPSDRGRHHRSKKEGEEKQHDHGEDDHERSRKHTSISGGDRERKHRQEKEDHSGDEEERRVRSSRRKEIHKEEHRKKKRQRRDSDVDEEQSSREKRRKHSSRSSRKSEKKTDRHHGSKKHSKRDEKKKKDEKKRDSKKSKGSSNQVSLLKVDKSKLYPLGEPLGHAPARLLDVEADYFAYHKHLWLYLYRDCSTVFNDLTSEESRKAFADFCRLYNAGKLEAAYYNDESGLPVAALEECKTTRHSWGFRISDQEDKSLQVLQEGVHKQTEYHGAAPSAGLPKASSQASNNMGPPPAVAPRNDRAVHSHHRHMTPEERQRERVENRRLREQVRTVHEELTGGPKEGRERIIEQRRERADKIHGATRERDNLVGPELDDDALYGGSDRSQLERAKQQAARRADQKQARAAELQNKEKEKQAAMLEMLGLSGKIKAGEKIKIAPRNDGK